MDLLFSKGKNSLSHPVKMVWLETPVNLQYPVQAMFIVPKRQFKKAHDRNRLKRRMREAYRLHKSPMYLGLEASGKKFILAFIFIGKADEAYETIERSIVKLTGGIIKKKPEKL
jgi:ribonuclease P protein component